MPRSCGFAHSGLLSRVYLNLIKPTFPRFQMMISFYSSLVGRVMVEFREGLGLRELSKGKAKWNRPGASLAQTSRYPD